MSIYKIPGPLLIAMGGLFLSSGGAIFRSFEMADPWAIYFWRSVFLHLLFYYLFFLPAHQTLLKNLKV
jgi:hypothetical protein